MAAAAGRKALKLLLDTHAALWLATGHEGLGPDLRKAIAGAAGGVFISMASLWELKIKANLGKLRIPPDLAEGLEESGIILLSIGLRHLSALDGMPFHHKDPFDRMLIAQARVEGMTLVTADRMIRHYDVPVLWS